MIEETVVDKEYIKAMSIHREPNKNLPSMEAACAENPVYFAKAMLGITLYSWQVDFLIKIMKSMDGTDENKEFLAITSRQIGKSTAVAILALWSAFFNKYPGTTGNNTIVGVVSASQDQSRKLLSSIRQFLRMGDGYMRMTYLDSDEQPLYGEEYFSEKLSDKDPNNTSTISFKHYDSNVHGDYVLKDSKLGSVIKSYPPTSVVLGETFSVVIIDEAGKTDRISDEFFYEYIYPTGNSTNAVRIYISTPWVSTGFFYRMVNPDNEFDDSGVDKLLFSVDAIKLDNPEYHVNVTKIVNTLLEDGKRDEVSRAYFCRFVKGELSYFDPEKVRDMFFEDEAMLEEYSQPCDMGVDFGGQVKSMTVVTISTLDELGMIRRIYHRQYPVQEDDYLIDDIKELRERFNIERIVVDDCPAGDKDIRKMEKEGWDIVRMSFRAEKVRKYGNFRGALNKGKIISYKDKDLLKEMYAMEINRKSQQSNIQAAPGNNDDLIDSFVMSAYHYTVDESTEVKFFTWKGQYGK